MSKKQEQSSKMPSFAPVVFLVLVILFFLVKTWLVQKTFNCSIPSITGSKSFKIDFQSALCLTILCGLLFTSSTTVVNGQNH